MSNNHGFPPLETMPMLAYAISGGLDASQEQLYNLRRAEKKPYVLDDETAHSIIKSYTEQNTTIVDEKTLCAHWRKQNSTVEETKMIDEVTANLIEIENINQQIITLATYCKDYTIEKILNMEEGELALAHLTGKLTIEPEESKPSARTNYKRKPFELPPDVTC